MPKTTVFSQIHSYIYEMTTASLVVPFLFCCIESEITSFVAFTQNQITPFIIVKSSASRNILSRKTSSIRFGVFFSTFDEKNNGLLWTNGMYVWKKKLCKIHQRVRRASIGSNRQFQRRDDDFCKNQNKKNLKRTLVKRNGILTYEKKRVEYNENVWTHTHTNMK